MQKIWQQPFPSPQNTKSGLQMSCFAGICVFVILYFVKPFGLNELLDSKVFVLSIQYALVTILLSLFCNTIMPLLFPNFFTDKRWTVLHEIIFLIALVFIVALGNIVFTVLKSNAAISINLILKILRYTFVIGIIPIVISVVIKQQQLLIKYSKGATEMESLIAENNILLKPKVDIKEAVEETILQKKVILPGTTTPIILQIQGTNQQELLTIEATLFLFAEASDNYTAIHYINNGTPQKLLYRIPIKNLANQTSEAIGIFRCHKSYLVNLSQVTHITGNAQGYKLHLYQNKFEIPVSRSLNSSIKEKFTDLKVLK